MRFLTPEPGWTEISLFDYSGKMLMQKEEYLSNGLHTYRINGIVNKGFHFVRVRCGNYKCSGTLICCRFAEKPGGNNL